MFKKLSLLCLLLVASVGNVIAAIAPVDTATAFTSMEAAVDTGNLVTIIVSLIVFFIGVAVLGLVGGSIIRTIQSRGKRVA